VFGARIPFLLTYRCAQRFDESNDRFALIDELHSKPPSEAARCKGLINPGEIPI
jgi:hypothetical protein